MRRVHLVLLSLAAVLSLSCDSSDLFTGPLTSESCGSGGRSYSGSVRSGTWPRAASPHLLLDSVVVDGTLTIEPGSLVCGMPGSTLTVAGLEAVGAEDAPIVFTSDDPDGWGGLRGGGVLRHARIERTETAVWGSFDLERSAIVRTRSWAVRARYQSQQSTLRDVVIDSACTDGGCGAVLVVPFSGATLEDVIIRWSGGEGIRAGYEYCALTIDGGSIEGSAGVGLVLPMAKLTRSCAFTLLDPVRITGGAAQPAVVHADAAVQFLRDAQTQAALAGNAIESLLVNGERDFGDAEFTLTKDLPLRVQLSCSYYRASEARLGTVTMEPGASLSLGACDWGVHLRANGTAEEPVTIFGASAGRLHMLPGHADTAYLRHVVLRDDVVLRADSAPVIIEHIALHDSSLELFAAGSRIDGLDAVRSNGRHRLFTGGPDPRPTVVLHAGTSLRNAHIEQSLVDGIVVDGDDVSIEGCTVTTSAQHGIRVLGGASVIRSCNLVANAGDGVHNAGTAPVDAMLNWWGDATGPLGPDGDGVHGNVVYHPFLTAPAPTAAGGRR